MIPIYQMQVCHVEITNACNLECSNCTRHIGHHRKPFVMDLETVEKAILSLVTPYSAPWQEFPQGFPGGVGIMGGEPTTHPKLPEICELVQKHVQPIERRQFWTDGFRLGKHEGIIRETFLESHIHINRHEDKEVGWHQPLLIAAEEVMEDRELMWRLINNCWVQWRWSPSITPKGGFFCEVAASMDMLFDGPGGYPIEPGWWAKNPNDFFDQVDRSCTRCSAAIPMPAVSAHDTFDLVSPGNLKRLLDAGSPRAKRGDVVVFDKKITREDVEKMLKDGRWAPWDHRGYQVYGDEQRIRQTKYNPLVVTRDGDQIIPIESLRTKKDE